MNKPIRTFTEAASKRIVETVKRVEQMRPRQRSRRQPVIIIPPGNASGSGNCGCPCKLIQVSGTEIDGAVCDRGPNYWQFSVGAMDCGCDGDTGSNGEGGTVKLYFVVAADGKDIWQSTPVVICPGDLLLDPGCLSCDDDPDCEDPGPVYGYQSYRYEITGGGSADWTPLETCGTGTGSALGNYVFAGFPLAAWSMDKTFTWPCFPDDSECYSGDSVCYESSIIHQGTPDAETVWAMLPDQPDCPHFVPTSAEAAPQEGMEFCSPCCNEHRPPPAYAYGYWRLSVGTLNESTGHNSTRLTFRAAGCEILQYELAPGHCFRCLNQNEMRLRSCGPFGCEKPPSKVCLIPKMGG